MKMESNSTSPLRLTESPHNDDSSGDDDEEESSAVPTARYVEGVVGLVRNGWTKYRAGASHRRGTLVIELGGDDEGRSGTLRFFYDGMSGWRTGGGKGKGSDGSPERRGKGGVGGIGCGLSGVMVRAVMESYVEPPEGPYLRIPPVVPWKFEVVGDNYFNIVVPPLEGRMDHRVELMKPSHMLKMKKLGLDDKDSSSNESLDGVSSSSKIDNVESSNKDSQVFKFHCHEGELAVYAKAAQSLRRNLNKCSATKVNHVVKAKASRKRTEVGIEIAAQSALIERSRSIAHIKPRRMSTYGEQEYRISPDYCYPNTWMTKKDIAVEVQRASSEFHDLRNGHQDEIGSLKIEVLQCIGLPKTDRFGLTDAYCFIVSGSSAFVTDVIPEICNPCWLPLSKRACILPIFNAYSQVYVGVFDYDGEKSKDDFAGRVVIDIPQLQPGLSMDITLPLRQFSHIYKKKKQGSIRLRLKLDWGAGGERAALLSYLPGNLSDVTRRIEFPPKPVTVACPDAKSFSNVARTVYGKDIPGRFSMSMMSEVTEEQKLMKETLVSGSIEIAADIVGWKQPFWSFYIFCGWMLAVAKGPAFVPAWIASLLLMFMLKNYLQYHINSATANLYGRRTIGDMTRSLLFKQVGSKNKTSRNLCSEKNSLPIMERVLLRMFGMSPVQAHPKESDSWMFEDNSEFPFSVGSVHSKRTSDEAAAEPLWEAAQDEFSPSDFGGEDEGEFSDDHDEIDDDTGSMIKRLQHSTKLNRKAALARRQNIQTTTTHADIGLQDQNGQNNAKGLDAVKFQIDLWQAWLHQVTFHLFDERVFVADRADAEKLLQIDTGSNPIKRMIYPLMADVIKLWRTEVSVVRVIFNILYFKDPMLSYWVMVLVFCLMIILFIFPWQKLFFALGLLGLGPQNYFLEGLWRDSHASINQHTVPEEDSTTCLDGSEQLMSVASGRFRRRHSAEEETRSHAGGKGHLALIRRMDLSKSPLLMRNNIHAKPDDKPREIIVPSIPFRYNRFYDWPPDPASATIK